MMLSDDDLAQHVREHLDWDARVQESEIAIDVDTGTVTLRGTAPSWRARQAAEDDARSVPGVVDVHNEIAIQHELPAVDDNELRRRVSEKLRWDPDVDETEILVLVADGVVTLRGVVDAMWKKQIALDKAHHTIGTREVRDELTVVPPMEADDATIRQDISLVLDRDPILEGSDVEVRVEDGHVTLSGSVPDPVAHDEAVTLAFYTRGVVDVHDELRVRV